MVVTVYVGGLITHIPFSEVESYFYDICFEAGISIENIQRDQEPGQSGVTAVIQFTDDHNANSFIHLITSQCRGGDFLIRQYVIKRLDEPIINVTYPAGRQRSRSRRRKSDFSFRQTGGAFHTPVTERPLAVQFQKDTRTGIIRYNWFRFREKLGIETEQLEFKRGYIIYNSEKFKEEIVKLATAFLNAQGGTLLYGVEDTEGQVLGIEYQGKKSLDIAKRRAIGALRTVDIIPTSYRLDFLPIYDNNNRLKDEVVVLQFVFEADSKPTIPFKDLNGRAWIRSSGACLEMTDTDLQNWTKKDNPIAVKSTGAVERTLKTEQELNQLRKQLKTSRETQLETESQLKKLREEQQQHVQDLAQREAALQQMQDSHQQQIKTLQEQIQQLHKPKKSKTCTIL